MADRDYKAFIVEGEVREPQIIDNISKVFFAHGNFKIITLPAEENIYMLWKKLKADDFDTDIIEVLRESNDVIREQLEGLSRDDFSEVYLFFDSST
jgi:predicted secreted protein